MNKIELTTDEADFRECAKMMCESEPWLTLKRTFDDCLASVHGIGKEVYVVRENSEIIALAILQMAGTFKGYLQSIIVHPKRRGCGIGSELLTFCENRIFQISPNVFMCVSEFNTEAAKLYYRLGYVKVGVLDNFVVQGKSEILIRKTIGSISDFANR